METNSQGEHSFFDVLKGSTDYVTSDNHMLGNHRVIEFPTKLQQSDQNYLEVELGAGGPSIFDREPGSLAHEAGKA